MGKPHTLQCLLLGCGTYIGILPISIPALIGITIMYMSDLFHINLAYRNNQLVDTVYTINQI